MKKLLVLVWGSSEQSYIYCKVFLSVTYPEMSFILLDNIK